MNNEQCCSGNTYRFPTVDVDSNINVEEILQVLDRLGNGLLSANQARTILALCYGPDVAVSLVP